MVTAAGNRREPGLVAQTGRFEVFVEDLLDFVMDGKLLFLAAFLLEPEQKPFPEG
jgi:hypothetical protein